MNPLSLRAALRLVGVGLVAYVAVLAVVIATRLIPAATVLRQRSDAVLREFDATRERTASLAAAIERVHELLLEQSGRAPADPDPFGVRAARLRAHVDSAVHATAAPPRLGAVPADLRAEFAAANVEGLRVGTALVAAIASLEVRRFAAAARQLAAADSSKRSMDQHFAAAERLLLVDLSTRDRALAEAARGSVRTIGWWLAGGALVTPLIIVFLRRRFYDPLAELDRGLARVAQGRLDEPIPVRRADELGRLSTAFNETTALLRERAEDARRRAQRALRESEERYETMVEFAPIGVAVVAASGRYVHTNPALQRFLGYTEEELRGRGFRDVTAPEDLAVTDRRFADLVSGASDRFQLEKRYVRKDGTVVWGRLSVSAVRNPGGALAHTVSMVEDVTEEKRRETGARAIEQRFRAVVSGAPIMLFGIDPSGIITVSEGKGLAALGQRPGEVVGDSIFDRLADAPTFAEPFRRALAGEALHEIGTYRGVTLEAWVTPMRDPENRIVGAIGVATDVTARIRAEAARRKSEEMFATAFRLSPNPSLITRLEDGVLVDVNAAFSEATGYTREEVIGRSTRDVLWPEPHRRDAMVAALREHGRVRGLELRMRTRAGPPREVLVSIEVIELDGVAHTLGAAVDITDRKHLEESVRRSETMAALGAVVAGVAHEVRNPLFGLSATVDAFEARFGSDPARRRYTDTLRQEVGRLSKLMQDLLEYGKPPRLEIAAVALGPVVRGAVAACGTMAGAAGVTVSAQLPDDLPAVTVDPSRVQQVVHNLIANAIQHSPSGSAITVSASLDGGPPAAVDVAIADQGPGFREEDLPHLFEPFFTRRRGGTGLGLSIVQRIVEQHDGTIRVANRPTGGAVVTVRLTLEGPAHAQT